MVPWLCFFVALVLGGAAGYALQPLYPGVLPLVTWVGSLAFVWAAGWMIWQQSLTWPHILIGAIGTVFAMAGMTLTFLLDKEASELWLAGLFLLPVGNGSLFLTNVKEWQRRWRMRRMPS